MEIRSIDGFLAYLPRIRKRTQRVVDLVPDDRLDWRPDPGAFSFADLLRHVTALERYLFAENVRGDRAGIPATVPSWPKARKRCGPSGSGADGRRWTSTES
ncbi:MAG: DinB family protein [Gemmatimonadota bacterium]